MIKIYVYDKETGFLEYVDTGQPEFVIHDLADDCDFTLVKPPTFDRVWAWNGEEWVKANEQN